MEDLNLAEVDSPWKVSDLLRRAAQRYVEDASELEAAWQDREAGRPWVKIAKILESAADRIDKAIGR